MKTIFSFSFIFLFFYVLNAFTPMSFGDDYVYSFIWEGHPMYEPLSEEARRLLSFQDLLESQWSHYFTGNGRTVSHTIIQFFLWKGKDLFNFFNAVIFLLLIIEIYWCANKGKVTCHFALDRICWIFFALWAFTPGFPNTLLWLSGACNYLWTAVLLLGFLLPYIRKYYFFEETIAKNNSFQFVMFFFGILAGWTNENSVCWIIVSIFVFIYAHRKKRGEIETWMVTGLAGLIIGYSLLMLAPGNFVRLSVETTGRAWLTWEKIANRAALLFLIVVLFHIVLWNFTLHSFNIICEKEKENISLAKEVLVAKSMCLLSFCMTFVMLFFPNFPTRSAFPGTVLLIISASVLLRVQDEYVIILIKKNAIKFLRIIGSMYFVISVIATVYGSYYDYKQNEEFLSLVKSSVCANKNVIVVNTLPPVNHIISKLSCFHLISHKLTENENDWRNVAFSRYYGIKGIRMVEKD